MSYLLIVDDDEDFAIAAATILRNAGHDVDIALDIDSAGKSILARPPDLIILDVMFPESSSAGFTFARELRHFNEKLRTIPILMLTAINASFPLGFSSLDIDDSWMPVEVFMEKPVDMDLLSYQISKMLGTAG